MVMDLYDRTPGRDGEPLTTRISGTGTGSITMAAEPVTLFDRDYPRGTLAEVVIEAILHTTDGSKWTSCQALPSGLRYARPCEGVNTDTLKVFVGTGTFATGVKQPPLECKEDHEPVYGRYPDTTQVAIKVTPHIKYCGYFDWGINSQVTSVETLLPTEIWIAPPPSLDLHVCSVDFVGGNNGTIIRIGADVALRGQVLFVSTKTATCESGFTFPKVVNFERLYKSNGTVLYISAQFQ